MSFADLQRIMILESKVAHLLERDRILVARVAALEDHLADFQAAVEARQVMEMSAATPAPLGSISTPERPPNTPLGDAETCSSCVRRREQAQVRLRRHRAKLAAADGRTSREATA